ncbi:hypothetical protein EYF80_020411 [Liparis tanakae]|uniref:Uncharacterized protein n=1 Tax=Liparis tanakae TaxID=230148 RepID=A0A4Z2HUV3_9TELE|nr:hypothetical protein EYF80_020411 [Liparis tanakae]
MGNRTRHKQEHARRKKKKEPVLLQMPGWFVTRDAWKRRRRRSVGLFLLMLTRDPRGKTPKGVAVFLYP